MIRHFYTWVWIIFALIFLFAAFLLTILNLQVAAISASIFAGISFCVAMYAGRYQ